MSYEVITFIFDEMKATQAAALLIKQNPQRRESKLKLIKLLYIADRNAIAKWRNVITTDRYVAMKMGPVVSSIYDCMKNSDSEIWSKYIKTVDNNTIALIEDPGTDELSKREQEELLSVYETYKGKNSFEMVEIVHKFKEWSDPGSTSIPIPVEDICKQVFLDDYIDAAISEVQMAAMSQKMLYREANNI